MSAGDSRRSLTAKNSGAVEELNVQLMSKSAGLSRATRKEPTCDFAGSPANALRKRLPGSGGRRLAVAVIRLRQDFQRRLQPIEHAERIEPLARSLEQGRRIGQ